MPECRMQAVRVGCGGGYTTGSADFERNLMFLLIFNGCVRSHRKRRLFDRGRAARQGCAGQFRLACGLGHGQQTVCRAARAGTQDEAQRDKH